ncbi:MAG: hypothetical protein WA652_09050 [Xanthobacteraceae bacterium]
MSLIRGLGIEMPACPTKRAEAFGSEIIGIELLRRIAGTARNGFSFGAGLGSMLGPGLGAAIEY